MPVTFGYTVDTGTYSGGTTDTSTTVQTTFVSGLDLDDLYYGELLDYIRKVRSKEEKILFRMSKDDESTG